jgi:hypothetical protein
MAATCREESDSESGFPRRAKQDVLPAASRDGFTAARKTTFRIRRRTKKQLSFMMILPKPPAAN